MGCYVRTLDRNFVKFWQRKRERERTEVNNLAEKKEICKKNSLMASTDFVSS